MFSCSDATDDERSSGEIELSRCAAVARHRRLDCVYVAVNGRSEQLSWRWTVTSRCASHEPDDDDDDDDDCGGRGGGGRRRL